MDKEIKEEILRWMMGVRETSSDAANFALEQAPLVAQEYLTYWTVVHGAWAACFMIIALVMLWQSRNVPTWVGHEDFPAKWALRLGMAGPLAIAIPNLVMAIKCQVSPRLVILEWAVDTLKRVL